MITGSTLKPQEWFWSKQTSIHGRLNIRVETIGLPMTSVQTTIITSTTIANYSSIDNINLTVNT